jgi:hypothetical protein
VCVVVVFGVTERYGDNTKKRQTFSEGLAKKIKRIEAGGA